jgi:hypothetical protein
MALPYPHRPEAEHRRPFGPDFDAAIVASASAAERDPYMALLRTALAASALTGEVLAKVAAAERGDRAAATWVAERNR